MSLRHPVRCVIALLVGVTPVQLTAQQTVLAGTPIHQEADVAASPRRVYDALLTASQFAAFSGMKATIAGTAGGAFTIFDGHILGRNVELVPGTRVVQAWRTADWPAGVYSIVRFELQARGTGTHLVFDQTGFPEAERTSLTAGWQSHYWSPLKKYLR